MASSSLLVLCGAAGLLRGAAGLLRGAAGLLRGDAGLLRGAAGRLRGAGRLDLVLGPLPAALRGGSLTGNSN